MATLRLQSILIFWENWLDEDELRTKFLLSKTKVLLIKNMYVQNYSSISQTIPGI